MSYVSEEIVKDLVPGQADLCSRSGGLRCRARDVHMWVTAQMCVPRENSEGNDIKAIRNIYKFIQLHILW